MMKIALSSGTGKWNFYWAAEAAYDAGILDNFYTGVYYKQGIKTKLFSAVLPANLQINRRSRVPDAKITTLFTPELCNAALMKLKLRHPALTQLSYQLYDWLTYHSLHDGIDIFHVRNGFGNASIKKARQLGAITITDFGGAHPNYVDEAIGQEYNLIGKRYRPQLVYDRFRQEFDSADHIFVNSEFVRDTFREKDPDNHSKIQVFYRGFDPSRFVPDFAHRQRRIEERQPFRVACMARIELNKGVHYLLEAWKQLKLPDAELVLIGHPGAADEYEYIMSRYADVFTHVKFVANNELSDFYRHFDAWSLCSLTEGSSMSVYEAMACGLPCIVSENTGSVVRNGIDGFVHPIRNVDAIKAGLLQLYENRELSVTMGQQARDFIAGNYTWAHYQQKLVNAYRRLERRACVA